jgi:CheY-like chemotaxis protein
MILTAGENRVTIVMIEDDEGHSRLIERSIRRAGVDNPIETLRTAREAIEFLSRADGPLLVLLDLNLPDANGIEVLRRLRSDEATKAAPVIVLTTTDDEGEVQRCYELGCNVYMSKPGDYRAFAAAMQELAFSCRSSRCRPPRD